MTVGQTARVVYPPIEGDAPNPYSREDLARIEDGLRELAMANALIQRCERCKIPVENARRDCDDACVFLQGILGEFQGPQSPIGGRDPRKA